MFLLLSWTIFLNAGNPHSYLTSIHHFLPVFMRFVCPKQISSAFQSISLSNIVFEQFHWCFKFCLFLIGTILWVCFLVDFCILFYITFSVLRSLSLLWLLGRYWFHVLFILIVWILQAIICVGIFVFCRFIVVLDLASEICSVLFGIFLSWLI